MIEVIQLIFSDGCIYIVWDETNEYVITVQNHWRSWATMMHKSSALNRFHSTDEWANILRTHVGKLILSFVIRCAQIPQEKLIINGYIIIISDQIYIAAIAINTIRLTALRATKELSTQRGARTEIHVQKASFKMSWSYWGILIIFLLVYNFLEKWTRKLFAPEETHVDYVWKRNHEPNEYLILARL